MSLAVKESFSCSYLTSASGEIETDVLVSRNYGFGFIKVNTSTLEVAG